MTIEKFLEACPGINVVTVLPEAHMSYWRSYCLERNFTCPQILVKGGITRFHSVRNALAKVPDNAIVAIHDGVRPLVTVNLLRDMFELSENEPALIPVVPCIDTMKVLKEEGGKIVAVPGASVDRSVLFGAQTPQVFHSEIIKEAYSLAYDTSFTDDASVLERYGKSLSYIHGERLNMKITTKEDLVLARAILSLSSFS